MNNTNCKKVKHFADENVFIFHIYCKNVLIYYEKKISYAKYSSFTVNRDLDMFSWDSLIWSSTRSTEDNNAAFMIYEKSSCLIWLIKEKQTWQYS